MFSTQVEESACGPGPRQYKNMLPLEGSWQGLRQHLVWPEMWPGCWAPCRSCTGLRVQGQGRAPLWAPSSRHSGRARGRHREEQRETEPHRASQADSSRNLCTGLVSTETDTCYQVEPITLGGSLAPPSDTCHPALSGQRHWLVKARWLLNGKMTTS